MNRVRGRKSKVQVQVIQPCGGICGCSGVAPGMQLQYQDERREEINRLGQGASRSIGGLRSTAVPALIVIAFHPRLGACSLQIDPRADSSLSYPLSDFDPGGAPYEDTIIPIHGGDCFLCPSYSLSSGKTHVLPEGCAFRSLTCPAVPNYRLVQLTTTTTSPARRDTQLIALFIDLKFKDKLLYPSLR